MKKVIFKSFEFKRYLKRILKNFDINYEEFIQIVYPILFEYKLDKFYIEDIKLNKDNLIITLQDSLIINWSLKEDVILVSKICADDIKHYDVFKKIFANYSKMYTIYNKDNNKEISILNSDLESKLLTDKIIRKYVNNMIKYGNPMKTFKYEFRVLDTTITLKLTFPTNNSFNENEFLKYLYEIEYNRYNIDEIYLEIKKYLSEERYFLELFLENRTRNDYIIVDDNKLLEYKRFDKDREIDLIYKDDKLSILDHNPNIEEFPFVKKMVKKEI